MKKRALSLLMSLVMLVSMLPTTAWAASEDQKSVTVQASFYDGRSQEFVMVPQELEVNSGEATKLGYETKGLTQNADEVTVFDALVKAHEVLLGGTDGVTDALTLNSSGWLTTVMGETDPFSFAVNGVAPNDGIYNENNKGYTGYSIDQAVLNDGDEVQFFFYEDGDQYSDLYATFDKDTALIRPEDTLELVASGYVYVYYNCSTPEVIAERTQKISGARLCTLNMETGKLSPIAEKVTDSNGKVSVSFQEEGIYYLTLQSDKDYLIAPICKVTVSADAPSQERSCRLTSLNVMNFSGFTAKPSKALDLTPAFAPDTTEYSAEEWAFTSTRLDQMCYVSVEPEEETAKVEISFNGKMASGPYVGNMLPGQDNILTITVTNGEQSKTYTVTIPMAADPAAPVLVGDKTAAATVKKGDSYTLDLTKVFAKGTSDADLTYQVSVDGAAAESVVDGTYTNTWAKSGTYTLVFTAKSGKLTSPTYTVTLNVQPETVLVMHNIAAKYAASGVAQDSNSSYWLAADMMAYEKTFPDPDSANKLTREQKQAMVDVAVKTMETSTKPGDLSKSIIALTAMGYDATKITTDSGAALDGVAKLAAMVNDKKNTDVTNIYTLPYVMIALQQFGDTYKAELDKLTNSALYQKLENGGWSWGANFDADATNPVILALAPYVETNPDVKDAMDKAVTAMAAYQNEKGSVGNGASTGLAIAAVSALGMDPAAFVNKTSGKSLVDGLLANALASEDGFDSNAHSFGTEQGFRGLIALANYQEGKSYRLYDFSGQTLVPAVATFWAKNAAVSVKTIPEDAAVVVKSGETEVAADKVHGAYDLAAGDYTYTVSKDGYVTKTGSFTITAEQVAGHEKQTIHVSLVSAGSGSGSSSKDIKVTVKVMVPPADQSKRYTYKHDSRSYTNLLTTTGKVTVTAGSSVRDAFVTALDRDKIGYTEQSNGYFPTIGSWSEFERGEKSGWMYLVNGSMPSVAAQDYELTGNATVVWFYTDDYSNDYGSESWDDDSSSSGTTTTPTTPTTPANPVPDKAMSFTDVKSNDWYYSSVRYAYDNGLFSGVSHDSFGPGDSMDRSMLATVLYSLDGKPAAGKSGFADVADGAWYADAVAWAAEHGIVSGVGGGAFTPGGTITREQLAVMLYRYAQYKGYDVSKTADLSGYADQDKLSDWAAQAVQWACGSGLMNGRSAAQLAPEGTLTRAEAATMLKAFCENVKK